MDPEPDLGADLQAREPDEHVEGVDDPAVGRVLQRDDPELDVPAVDLLEDRGDRADRDVLDRLAELGDGGQVAVAVLRARGRRPAAAAASDRRAAHQLAEDRAARSLAGSGPRLAARARAMTSSSRAGDQTSSPCFCLTWPIWSDDLGAAVQQGDEFLVDPVDLAPEAREGRRTLGVGGRACGLGEVDVGGSARACGASVHSGQGAVSGGPA